MNSHNWTVLGFAIAILSVFAVDFVGRRPESRIPSFSDLTAYLMRPWFGRALVLFFWWWLGWHFLAR